MKLFSLICFVAILALAGCMSVKEDTAKAYIMQTDSVVEEWNEMVTDAYRQNEEGEFEPWFKDDQDGTREEKIERRERKYQSSNILADELAAEIGYTRNKGD